MKIRRRLYNREKHTIKEKIETATLVSTRAHSVLVKLTNGDMIKRKIKDVTTWDKK